MNAKLAVGLLVVACGSSAAETVSESKVWKETYPVSASPARLVVSNIWGNVKVRPGSPGKIEVTVDELRSAPTQALFEQSKRSIYVDVQADVSGVSMIVDKPESPSRFELCRGCRVEYQFDVTVPPGTEIDVSTVTDGLIDVADINGPISASNVNGPVAVRGLKDCAQVESVNGGIDLVFAQTPTRDCSIETINGDIVLIMPSSASLDAGLKLFHGRVVSEFDLEPLALPAKVEQTKRDTSIVYRIEQAAGVRVGAGGPRFDIASLNGDIQFRKSK